MERVLLAFICVFELAMLLHNREIETNTISYILAAQLKYLFERF